jgi:glutaredoxin-related protein
VGGKTLCGFKGIIPILPTAKFCDDTQRAFRALWRAAASQIDSRQVWGVQSKTNLKERVRERDEKNHIGDWIGQTGMPPANRLSSAPE